MTLELRFPVTNRKTQFSSLWISTIVGKEDGMTAVFLIYSKIIRNIALLHAFILQEGSLQ